MNTGFVSASAPSDIDAALMRIARRDVHVPVRFGGDNAHTHDVWLRFGPVDPDGCMAGNVLVELRGQLLVVERAIVYDPVIRGFAYGNREAISLLGERLDPLAACFGMLSRETLGAVRMLTRFIFACLAPGFFVIGTVLGILLFFGIYYSLFAYLAQNALFYVIIPGTVVGVACRILSIQRLQRLHTGIFQAAHAALASGQAG